jgi:hypothetical protein
MEGRMRWKEEFLFLPKRVLSVIYISAGFFAGLVIWLARRGGTGAMWESVGDTEL